MHLHLQQKIHYLLKSKITEIYLTFALRTFALSMITIFVPIFLLKQGYGLIDVAGFFLLKSILVLLTVKQFLAFAAKKGVKHSIAFSTPFIVAFFVGLHELQALQAITGGYGALITLAVLDTVSNLLYYMGFHIDFSKVHTAGKAAKQVSVLHATSIAFSIIGPFLGAVIITWSSFQTLFAVNAGILFLAITPLFASGEIHETIRMRVKDVFTRKAFKQNLMYYGEGIRFIAAGTYWPVLLYLIAVNLQEIGGIFTISQAIFAAITIYIGRVSTETNQHHILKWGAFIQSASLAVRGFMRTVALITVAQGLGAISWGMINIPFSAMHYNRSQKHGVTHIIYSREVFLHLGQVTSLIIIATLLLAGVPEVTAIILLLLAGAIATLAMRRITED